MRYEIECEKNEGDRHWSSGRIVKILSFFGKKNIDEPPKNEYSIVKLDYLFEVGAMQVCFLKRYR